MSHLRRTAIPNSWDEDDDDWGVPQPTSAPTPPVILSSANSSSNSTLPFASADAPVVITSATQQPKTFYKPEITLLRRASPSLASPAPSSRSSTASSRTADERERERKEKERRYQEAKDRIFAATEKEKGRGKKAQQSQSQSQAQSQSQPQSQPKPQAPKKTSPARTSPNSKSKQPSSPNPPPPSTGTITGFSLNSGTFSTAPVKARERSEWQLKQVALDGKMLESKAEQYGFGTSEEPLGDREHGIDWDDFRRDRWEGGPEDELTGKLESLDFVEVGESTTESRLRTPRGESASGSGSGPKVVMPVREPKGPDSGGSGFSGRGRGSGRRGASSS